MEQGPSPELVPSVTAFIGRAIKGPEDKATLIHNFTEFVSFYGGLWKESFLGYVVDQYFNNGGRDALIIRVHNGATKFEFGIELGSPTKKLILESANPGSWAKNFLAQVIRKKAELDPDLEAEDKTLCNIIIYENLTPNEPDSNKRELVQLETFRNVSLDNSKPRHVASILQYGSELVRVKSVSGIDSASGIGNEITYDSTTSPNSKPDGEPITATEIQGTPDPKRGLFLLEDTDIFNLLCIPSFRMEDSPENSVDDLNAMYNKAHEFCEKKRGFLIVDPLVRWANTNKVVDDCNDSIFPSTKKKNMGLFFPRIICPDKENENRTRNFPPCGAIAGIFARTDAERGVWKAPAGLDETLNGVVGLTVNVNDEENGDLNKLGVNCLRTFFGGPVVWGSRTLRGDDRFADEWKYIPVRRTALYIEESLYRGTQWVVFEPNDETLWSQVRLNVGAFMQDLFMKGAFQGTDPKKAYFVKCDDETTTETDIARGIVNIIVGFAPKRPAEFVIIKIQQITQSEASA